MSRRWRLVVIVAPWAGVAAVAWRQATLEAEMAKWLAAANASLQLAIEGLAGVAKQTYEDGVSGVAERN